MCKSGDLQSFAKSGKVGCQAAALKKLFEERPLWLRGPAEARLKIVPMIGQRNLGMAVLAFAGKTQGARFSGKCAADMGFNSYSWT